jgi:hypothetical protein
VVLIQKPGNLAFRGVGVQPADGVTSVAAEMSIHQERKPPAAEFAHSSVAAFLLMNLSTFRAHSTRGNSIPFDRSEGTRSRRVLRALAGFAPMSIIEMFCVQASFSLTLRT